MAICEPALKQAMRRSRGRFTTKAVGEPPLMLAISVREAIRDAVAAFGGSAGKAVELRSPATAEAILGAISKRRN